MPAVLVLAHIGGGPVGKLLMIAYFVAAVIIAGLALRLKPQSRYQIDDDVEQR